MLAEVTQHDRDGSAKVAVIGMDRSIAAWGRLYEHIPEAQDGILDILVHSNGCARPPRGYSRRPGVRPAGSIAVHGLGLWLETSAAPRRVGRFTIASGPVRPARTPAATRIPTGSIARGAWWRATPTRRGLSRYAEDKLLPRVETLPKLEVLERDTAGDRSVRSVVRVPRVNGHVYVVAPDSLRLLPETASPEPP